MSITNKLLLRLCLTLVSAFVLVSCGTLSSTRAKLFPKVYSEKPASILIMPPINETNHVEAKDYFYTSLMKPLSERGYYIFSPYLAMELLQSESAADAEMFIDRSLKPFVQVFNADAALFTIVKQWEKSVLLNTIDVEVQFILKSTRTEEVMFERHIVATVDCAVVSDGGLLGMIANAVITAATEKIVGARKASAYAVADLPLGKFSPEYGKDGNMPAQVNSLKKVVIR
ncbi:GNA1162 family protein [Porphyromonas sp. COT-290 OH3588]|uniref:GNA1162 family protein n=1 Tax=Porphyromonas sp. COT-290 OH3588 TaxID=1515617 RepID=UPI00052C5752|nr:GNA1162 family protein [Porphyromonas sp. COT-290 OH3588]KGO01316.1 bacterial lipoprotein [Porphyromonas sp. COT-290 OH3588]